MAGKRDRSKEEEEKEKKGKRRGLPPPGSVPQKGQKSPAEGAQGGGKAPPFYGKKP